MIMIYCDAYGKISVIKHSSLKKLDIFVSLFIVAPLGALHGDQSVVDVVDCCHVVYVFVFLPGYFGGQFVDLVLSFMRVNLIIRLSIYVLAFWS